MTRWSTLAAPLALALVLGSGAWVLAAPPCDPPTDPDDDAVCDPDDNCPLVANLDQVDTDGDLIGDACDRPLNVVIGKLRGAKSDTKPTGTVRLRGDFLTKELPHDVLDATQPITLTATCRRPSSRTSSP